jgi:hypothetical protein
MSRLPVALLLSTGCMLAPQIGESASEAEVQRLLASYGSGRDNYAIDLISGGFPHIRNTSGFSHEPGPAALRAAAERIAGCGQGERDPLDVRIYVTDAWPWTVRIREATPGAEACLAELLGQLPLDADLGGAARYVAARTTVADLRAPLASEVNPRECTLTAPMLGVMTQNMLTDLGSPADVAWAVTCPSAAPSTELTLRYALGELVGVETSPEVPCVEARAEEALRDVAALRIHYAPSKLAPRQTVAEWEAVACTVTVPLRPAE